MFEKDMMHFKCEIHYVYHIKHCQSVSYFSSFFFLFFSFLFITNIEMLVSNYILYTFIPRKEGNVLFNDALNTFVIYGYMASDIW